MSYDSRIQSEFGPLKPMSLRLILRKNLEQKKVMLDMVAMVFRLKKLIQLLITDAEYYEQAKVTKLAIQSLMASDTSQIVAQAFQSIFIEQEHRLYHWVDDRSVEELSFPQKFISYHNSQFEVANLYIKYYNEKNNNLKVQNHGNKTKPQSDCII